ncbi:MAG TPA: PAS domain-containing protein [Thermoanaerobaculia bacterium]|nr:PAS domain-containing protein [Thermoanaerobaculia bacterium]
MQDDLSALSAAEIDALPFGYIALAADGTIRKYNRYEADLARKDPQEVLGRNFFHEVAPCTQVQEFEGRFRQFAAGATTDAALTFDFEFGFRHGRQGVRIGFVRSPLGNEVIVTINRRRKLDLALSPALTPEPTQGTLTDAVGLPVTALNEDFWGSLYALWRHAPVERRREALHRLGHEWGLRHARRVERLIQRQHGVTLREAELQMALECLSGSLALLGLGRFDVDFRLRQNGLLPIDHHHSPFTRMLGDPEVPCCDPLAGLHAGFLSHLAGRQLAAAEVHCGRAPGEPCRFVVGTEGRLERLLRPAEGSADAVLLARLQGLPAAEAPR